AAGTTGTTGVRAVGGGAVRGSARGARARARARRRSGGGVGDRVAAGEAADEKARGGDGGGAAGSQASEAARRGPGRRRGGVHLGNESLVHGQVSGGEVDGWDERAGRGSQSPGGSLGVGWESAA